MKTLVILSSILGDRSKSRQLADHMVARIKQADPSASITLRDIGAEPIPYFDGATAGALFTPAEARSLEQQRIVELSDTLVAELMAADRIVFAVPVYNFNLPAQFKSYLDYLARAGVTFRYTPEGVPEGLVKGKQVFVLTSRGGKAEGTPADTMTPYLRQMLAFMGMTDVTFIAAEGLAMGELAAMEGLALAKQRIDESMPGAVQPALQAASDVRHEACCRVHGAFFQVRSAMKSGPQANSHERRRGAASVAQALDQAGRIPAAAAHFLHIAVELVHQRGQGQPGAVVARFGQYQAQVLRIQSTAKPKSIYRRPWCRHGFPSASFAPRLC